eukprot:Awhi_evm1s10345
MFARIYEWLKPGGVFVCSLHANDDPGDDIVDDWLDNGPMYWSGFNAEMNVKALNATGFSTLEHHVWILKEANINDSHDISEVPFLYVWATNMTGINNAVAQFKFI